MTTTLIYKILPRADWEDACRAGVYTGSADDRRDGYIHFSTGAQAARTARKYFARQENLVLVGFFSRRLGSGLKWEASRGGALFPHLYGPLETVHACSVEALPLDEAGLPVLPCDLEQRA